MSIAELKPTESELEILQIIWFKKEATVREVHDTLAKKKTVGYTTTLKLMQIMFEKGLLTRNTDTKSHLYEAAVSQDKTQKLMLNKVIDSLFLGSSVDLVMQALGNKKTSKKDLDQIRKYLKQLDKKGK
jgi:predicted transcriptional regulator